MAFSITQKAVGSADPEPSSTTVAVTLNSIAANALIAVFVKHEGASTTITVSDGTTSGTAGTYRSHTNNDVHGQWFYYLSHAGGTKTFTATFAAARVWRRIHVWEIALGADTAELGGQNTAQGTSTAPNSGSFSTTQATGIGLGGYCEYSNATVSVHQIAGTAADQTQGVNNVANTWARVLSATISGAANCTLSVSEAWVCCGIAFQAVGAGGAATFAGWVGGGWW